MLGDGASHFLVGDMSIVRDAEHSSETSQFRCLDSSLTFCS